MSHLTIRYWVVFVVFIFFNNLNAQDCFCKKDLDHYFSELGKTVSYKDQIKGSRKSAYDEAYHQIKNQITCHETEFDCFALLNQLSYLIDDEHARLRTIPKILSAENYTNQEVIDAYKASDEYLQFPRIAGNLDSLEVALKGTPLNTIHGIYYKDGFKVGVFQPEGQNYYDAVVLTSPLPTWERGQIIFRLSPSPKGNYRYYHANLKDKRWMAISNERFIDGRLLQLNWKKDTLQKDYYLSDQAEKFEYKKIKNDLGYIKLGSFGMQSSNRNEAETFLRKLKELNLEKNLILDLRDNSGGGDKVSKPFLKFLKKEFKNGSIYILINSKTASNAEITAQRMRAAKNVTVAGLPSAGMLNYGSNYGNRVVLPSGRFYYKFTDMNFSKHLDYEGTGIPVDIELSLNQDWIEQIVSLFNQN